MSKPAASPDVAVIASAIALPVDGGAPAKRFRIVPFGTFGGRDGRGPWQLRDKAHAEQVIAATKAYLNGVDMVVNYDLPLMNERNNARSDDVRPDVETYIHRIGRTGRFGRKGTSFMIGRRGYRWRRSRSRRGGKL